MDIFSLGIAGVAAITVICFLAAEVVKAAGVAGKWLPAICGVLGGILGAAAYLTGMPEFPAGDLITAAAVGVVSGLAATGAHQVYKQIGKRELRPEGPDGPEEG